jgi:hypothetical protein
VIAFDDRPDRAWRLTETVELLATVRRNPAFAGWLQALPSLTSISR